MGILRKISVKTYAYFVGFLIFTFMAYIHFIDVKDSVIESGDTFMYRAYFILLISLLGSIIIFIHFYKKFSLHISFAFISLTLGLIYMQVFVGLSAPDEPVHYISAYKLSSSMMGLEATDEKGFVRLYDDAYYIEDMYNDVDNHKTLGAILGQESLDIASNWDEKIGDLPDKPTVSSHIPVRTSPLVYLPQALGMTIARLIGLDAMGLINMAKFMNLLLYSLLIALSIKILPFGKHILYAVSLLPMSLHLAASMSYDAMIIALYSVFIAKILAMAYTDKPIKLLDLLSLCALIAVCGPCKIVYSLLVALYLLIPMKKFSKKRYYVLGFVAIMLTMLIAMYMVNASTIASYATVESGKAFGNEKQNYGLIEVLTWPSLLVRMFYNTLIWEFDNYYLGLIGYSLSNLDEVLSVPYILVSVFGLGILAIALYDKKELPIAHRLWIVFIILGIVAGIELSMLVAWTKRGSEVIEGVQGRYFLPVLPALLCCIYNKYIDIKIDVNNIVLTSFVFMQSYALIRLFATVALRIDV